MADNKNINSLDAEAEDFDTSELEVLSVDLIPTDEELEMDADTFSLDEPDTVSGSVESLKSDLRSRDERISSLQFDIEQLRSRWTGLEKEIEAREELTEILQTDLRSAHKALTARDRRISKLERDIDKLESQLKASVDLQASSDDGMSTLESQVDELTRRAAADAERIRELEAGLDKATAAARSEGGSAAAGPLAEKYAQRGDDLARLRRRQERLESDLRDTRAERGRLAAMLKVADAEHKDLRARYEDTRRKLRDAISEGEANRNTLAKQHGEIVGQATRLRELEAQLERSEKYADGLRRKHQQSSGLAATVEDTRESLAGELNEARNRIRSLESQLDEARTAVTELESSIESQRTSFDQEIATLRFELDEAQKTIASSDALNEKLARELEDGQSTRSRLARQVDRVEQDRDTQLESLRRSNAQLEAELAATKDKVANKDQAIAALLNELASKSRSIQSIEEIEHVVQEIDGRMSERIDDRSGADKDRPTRLLVGSIEGQELRFPLFKNRLTIGRTAQNDIQLRAQYISRRHAVIVVNDDLTRIVDWGSRNGVYVNRNRVSDKELKNGDVIGIGMAEFVYEERPRRESV